MTVAINRPERRSPGRLVRCCRLVQELETTEWAAAILQSRGRCPFRTGGETQLKWSAAEWETGTEQQLGRTVALGPLKRVTII